jgi:RNA polymerase sigma-70 factor, ECF subfamily
LGRDAEIELARRLSAGDVAAFDRFVEHFRTKIFQYSWLMCGHREDAEEVAQETLFKI